MEEDRFALVLGGGGAKGCYQIGAWKALREIGIRFSAVAGTSVGALNAALIAQGQYERAEELWQTASLDKIVRIPEELLQDGSLRVTRRNIRYLRELNREFLKNRGLDSSPLRGLIDAVLDEELIRRSGVELGIVTFGITDLRPLELFLPDIEPGLLAGYLLASASFPAFKHAEIDGKKYFDGAVYDNVPYAMIKGRGYRNIIVLDISGAGVYRRPDIVGTRTVYIRNSLDMGSTLNFRHSFLERYTHLGYLDTLKAFDRVEGIQYFLDEDRSLSAEFRLILESPETIRSCSELFDAAGIVPDGKNPLQAYRKLLPQQMRHYKDMVVALAECGALSLNIQRVRRYSFKEFLETIAGKSREAGIRMVPETVSSDRSHFRSFFARLGSSMDDMRKFHKYSPYEYLLAVSNHFGPKRQALARKALHAFFPQLLPGTAFLKALEHHASFR